MEYHTPFSPELQKKIDAVTSRQKSVAIGRIPFASPLILAPMSGITTPPFRLLMQGLGSGGSVSELVSCHGINHGNHKSRRMLAIAAGEERVGLQLFGEDAEAMSEAARVCANYNPDFVDINMGCPVRKVVSKGAGSALLREPGRLGRFFATIKKACSMPLSIKIRTGWDGGRNADEVARIAFGEGIEWVAVHGRTRAQQYKGEADWDYMESLAATSPLPIIGNGDLHTSEGVRRRLASANLAALMIARGALRNPFIFLESLDTSASFGPGDYLEVILRFNELLYEDGVHGNPLIQLKKHAVWWAHGFEGAARFRGEVFAARSTEQVLGTCRRYFGGLADTHKHIDPNTPFMAGGHG